MISYGLRLGAVNAGLALKDLNHLGDFVASHIARGSSGIVQLVSSAISTLPSALPAGEPVGPLRLHQGLAQLLGNTTTSPVSDIGILLAHSYRPAQGTFGLMFDLGFRTQDDQAVDMFTRVPRQGCAVFLGAIARAREGLEYDRQVEFTSVHEVGHVFNLVHQNYPVTFMASSEAGAPYGTGAFYFGQNQTKWLMRCETDINVMPGGSPFRDLGFGDGRDGRTVASKRLELTVVPSSDEFWAIEPIMLNVRLSVVGSSAKVEVPREIDPGYRRFRILIEAPDGTVRRYRSPLRFCSQGVSVEISGKRPFVRDLPLFGQAGGYTFKVAGVHRVWAEFDVTARTVLRSNVCSVNVLPAPKRVPKWGAVGSADRARALFYKVGEFDALADLVRCARSAPRRTRAMTTYICARAALPIATSDTKRRRWVLTQLSRCLECGDLPLHQTLRAAESLSLVE